MKRIGFLVVALVLVLGTLGVAYSKWSDNVAMTVNVGTDNVALCFDENVPPQSSDATSPTHVNYDQGGLGSSCDPINFHFENPTEQKDVASTDVSVADCKTLDVIVHNAYPFYYANIDFSICSTGSVPVRIWKIIITGDNGQPLTFYATPGPVGLDIDADGCCDMLLKYGDSFGDQLHQGQACADISMAFIFLECLDQSQTELHFTIQVFAVQWNEYDALMEAID